MKLAIMQPYFIPYIGYFQLINAVDKFVLYDDVSYINKGWINRNNILVNGNASLLTVPLLKASQNKLINEIDVSNDHKWVFKMLRTLELSYRKAPNFDAVYALVKSVLEQQVEKIAYLNFNLLKEICEYLGVETEFVITSEIYNNSELGGQNRILDICLKEGASHYINPIGGRDLYSSELFGNEGVKINFLKSALNVYPQYNNQFVPWLSIIDLLMFESVANLPKHLTKFELI